MTDPSDNSYLPPSDWRHRFIAVARERNPHFNECKNCGHRGRSVSDNTVMQNAWREGRTRVGEGFVVALVACDNCGHIELFSLEALGIEEVPGNPCYPILRSRSSVRRSE